MDIEIWCSEHNELFDIINAEISKYGDIKIMVGQCEKCLDVVHDEGYDEGYQAGLDQSG